VNFSTLLGQEIWFLVQGFEMRNYEKLQVHCAVRLFLPPSLIEKMKTFFYIAVGEFKVLAHFRDFGARNVISLYGFRREKLMEDSMIHAIFVIQIVISKIVESG
jgi:hypothetical protein